MPRGGKRQNSGPNRKPNKLKIIQGTDRADRMDAEVTDVIPCKELPEPPDFLDEHGKDLFLQMGKNFLHLQLLNDLNMQIFAVMICELSLYMQMQKEANEEGRVLTGIKTDINPKLKIANTAFKNFRSLCTEFGMTPSSMVNIAVQMMKKKEEKDPFEVFLDG